MTLFVAKTAQHGRFNPLRGCFDNVLWSPYFIPGYSCSTAENTYLLVNTPSNVWQSRRKSWLNIVPYKRYWAKNLEATHLTTYQRLSSLLMIVAIAFVWAYKIGIYRNREIKKINIKKQDRPAQSLFAKNVRSCGLLLIFVKKLCFLPLNIVVEFNHREAELKRVKSGVLPLFLWLICLC